MQTMTLILPCSCWFPQHIDDTFFKNALPHNRKKPLNVRSCPQRLFAHRQTLFAYRYLVLSFITHLNFVLLYLTNIQHQNWLSPK